MTSLPPAFDEVADLVWALVNERLDATGAALRQLLDGDATNRRIYIELMDQFASLEWEKGEGANAKRPDRGRPAAIDNQPTVIPSIVLDLSPAIRSPLFDLHSSVGGFLFSYAATAVIFGIGLLVSGMVQVSYVGTYAAKVAPSGVERMADLPDERVGQPAGCVGRITGLVDCRWADRRTQAFDGQPVPRGRKYVLAAGLMEIAYDTGAKVILQGPCRYEVESSTGGYLSLGKLTARVESRESRVERKSKYQTANLSELNRPQPSTLDARLFSVRTPTATVTDLGTEFAVEVGEEGATTSYVFRGSAMVQAAAGGGESSRAVLRENESARVEKGRGAGGLRLLVKGGLVDPRTFVRRLAAGPKTIDLLDVVAGGNGTGNRREHGIDPTTGDVDYVYYGQGGGFRNGNHQFCRTTWSWLVDGVFMPDGSAGAVQLDSAGHTFGGFPASSNRSYGSLWSRAAAISEEHRRGKQHWIYAIGPSPQFMPEGRGLLGFCGDMAITFNLEAARKLYPGLRPARFHAVAGVADCRPLWPTATPLARLWIFIDGQPKLSRGEFRPEDGVLDVDIAIGPKDRFLTLAIINGSTKDCGDWVVFGDPVLRMISTKD